MADSKKFASGEEYWEQYHNQELPPADEKEAASFQYSENAEYWLDYYEERINFALTNVSMQLKHAQERKREQDFEMKMYSTIALVVIGVLPIALAMPLSGVVPLVIFGAVLLIIDIWSFVIVLPICTYKIIHGLVNKMINDKDNELGEWLVRRYHVPRLTGEIQACQIYVGRYKEKLANIASWRDMLNQGSLDIDESELKNQMEKVNLDPGIEVAAKGDYRLKKLVNKTTLVVATITFIILFVLVVKGYMAYYDWWLAVWKSA